MYDYNNQIQALHDEKINIGEPIRKMLRAHREANQSRLMRNIREGISLNASSFVKQGSYANRTMVQRSGNDYDIDDGVVFQKEELIGDRGGEMTPLQVRDMVLDALKDEKFNKAPERLKNCVRVYYNEGHHLDVPSYRKFTDSNGNEIVEIASSEWRRSNPTEINTWFESRVSNLNNLRKGRGLQFRRMIRYLKRFGRSRDTWNFPAGLILTMLVSESLPDYERDDECFYYLLKALNSRLQGNKRVFNLADTAFPQEILTKSDADPDLVELSDRVTEALGKLEILHGYCTKPDARKAWDWVFKSDGFFQSYDDDHDGNDDGGSGSGTAANSIRGFTAATPDKPVDPQGGGRYG